MLWCYHCVADANLGALKTDIPAGADAKQANSPASVAVVAASNAEDGQGESRKLGQQNVNYRGWGGGGYGGWGGRGGWGGSPYGGWGELLLAQSQLVWAR